MDKVIAVVGPTASGKSELAVQIAEALQTEIISCDSMQVYKGMDIGTGKITEQQMQGIPHHLIDIQSVEQPYHVAVFQEKCRQAMRRIHEKGKIPVLCGGTGLYLKAALYDYTFAQEPEDPHYLQQLESKTSEQLYIMLEKTDPQAAQTIHPHNRKRLIRALMMAHQGQTKTQREQSQEHIPLYDVFFLGLDIDRQQLNRRIDARVEHMFEQGLEQEVRRLFQDPATWTYNSFQGIGYKEFSPYFQGECTLDQVKTNIQLHSRQYAKRQMTWFKHQMDVHWFSDPQAAKEAATEFAYGNDI